MPHRRSPRYRNPYAPRPKRSLFGAFSVLIVVLIVLLVFAIPAIVYVTTKTQVSFTVTDKAIKRTQDSDGSNGSDVYMIYTDHGVYKDTDQLFALKFNSSDLYGKLKVGSTYNCTASGFRIAFSSSYKNLISCNLVPKSVTRPY